jgi:hypothetical protein
MAAEFDGYEQAAWPSESLAFKGELPCGCRFKRGIYGTPLADELVQLESERPRCHEILANFVGGVPSEQSAKSDPSEKSRLNFLWKELIRHKLTDYAEAIGESRTVGRDSVEPSNGASQGSTESHPAGHAVKCVYSPSMADLCSHLFECVVIDEGVKMKGSDTKVGRGTARRIAHCRHCRQRVR